MAELLNAANRFRNGRAPGADQIEVEILKRAILAVHHEMLHMYNQCLEEEVFPDIWKIGSVKAIYKEGGKDREEIKSYRSTCLLPVAGKLLERLILNRLDPILTSGTRVETLI